MSAAVIYCILLTVLMTTMLRVSVEISASVTHPWQQWTSGPSPETDRPREAPFWLNFREEGHSASLI